MNANADFMEQNVIQINGEITINVNANVTKIHGCERDYIWNSTTCNCENGKYLASVMDDSAIICDEDLYFYKIFIFYLHFY